MPALTRPADFADDLLRVGEVADGSGRGRGQGHVSVVPEGPGPVGAVLGDDAAEEGVDVGHDDVGILGERRVVAPIDSQVGGGNRELDVLGGELGADRVELFAQLGRRYTRLFVQNFVADDDADEVRRRIVVENVVQLFQLARVRGGVSADVSAQPDFHGVVELQSVDGGENHFRLVAVRAV